MSHWNYRVMGNKWGYGIHEVHCDDGGTPRSWTDAIDPFGSTLEELRADLMRMLEALDKPVLALKEEVSR